MRTRDGWWLLRLVVLLGVLAWAAIAVAQEKVEGMVVSLRIDKWCTQPRECDGFVGVGAPGAATTLRVLAGTTVIRRDQQEVVLHELKLGDKAVAQFERKYEGNVASVIEVR
jgi:hypothetical protein